MHVQNNKRWGQLLIGGLIACVAITANAAPSLDAPSVSLTGVTFDLPGSGFPANEQVDLSLSADRATQLARTTSDADGNVLFNDVRLDGSAELLAQAAGGAVAKTRIRSISGAWSIVPPVLAIALALLFRSVIPALVAGIWVGATLVLGFGPLSWLNGLLNGFQVYVLNSLANRDHAAIILFSMMIGGMVGIVTRVGGMSAIVNLIVKRAKTAVAGQVSIWLMGLIIFFDDYGNTLVVGNTARPLSDKLGISREKLAYIVDSTAAPVACLAIATTWIGYEVGIIADAIAPIAEITESAYSIFLKTIGYSFYPVLSIFFVFAVAASGRDFGPMAVAEQAARKRRGKPPAGPASSVGDELEAKPGIPQRAVNALAPILVMVIALFAGLYVTGEGNTLSAIMGTADAYQALMWASILSVLTAMVLAVGQRLLTLTEAVDAWFGGVRAMLIAMIILILAWALSEVTGDLHTADYLISVLSGQIAMEWLPAMVFVLSAVTAFSTGSSWGTMGILMPLIIPLTWAIIGLEGDPLNYMPILYSAVACNLAGAVWGDHCSPISDTTVLSSMASGCDHIEHVRTQLPYAMTVGGVSIVLGTVPAAYGLPWWAGMILGVAALMLLLRVLGRPSLVDENSLTTT